MQTYRSEVTISKSGSLLLNDLPFQPGDKVEVLIRSRETRLDATNPYPLRGTPLQYHAPFDSVSEDAWDALS